MPLDLFNNPQIDPQIFQIFLQAIGIRYTETEPTHTPNKETEVWIYKDSTPNYWIYVWANGAWRTQKFGVTQVSEFQVGNWSFTVPSGTSSDTTTTHDFGFVPKMVFGTLSSVGANNAVFFGMWQDGQEQPTSIVTDGSGTSGTSFLGPDSSYYVNTLSVSGNVLTVHYKNNGVSNGTCKIWAIGK